MGIYYTCNICDMDGYDNVKAIAEYWDVEGQKWLVCKKCLKLVKQNKLDFKLLED